MRKPKAPRSCPASPRVRLAPPRAPHPDFPQIDAPRILPCRRLQFIHTPSPSVGAKPETSNRSLKVPALSPGIQPRGVGRRGFGSVLIRRRGRHVRNLKHHPGWPLLGCASRCLSLRDPPSRGYASISLKIQSGLFAAHNSCLSSTSHFPRRFHLSLRLPLCHGGRHCLASFLQLR